MGGLRCLRRERGRLRPSGERVGARAVRPGQRAGAGLERRDGAAPVEGGSGFQSSTPAEGLLFLPCLQGATAPEWNGAARGAFYGLTLAHTRAHLTRALLEGSAFALRDILEAMAGAGLEARRLTVVGGGAKSELWRQIKADVTGLPVRVPTNVETTATGAAILAAVGSGQYDDVAGAVDAFVAYEPREQIPDPECRERYTEAYAHYRELYFARKPLSRQERPAPLG